MDQYGVENLEQLNDTLDKIEEVERLKYVDDLARELRTGKSDLDGLKYYVAEINQLGWMNVDKYESENKSDLIRMVVDLDRDQTTDCTIIFKDQKSVLASDGENKKFGFDKILPGLAVWVLSLRYVNNRIYLSLKNTKTSESEGDLHFKEVSVSELKKELQKLDL
jgi:hypothetical protein